MKILFWKKENQFYHPNQKKSKKKLIIILSSILVIAIIGWFSSGFILSFFKIFTQNASGGSPFLNSLLGGNDMTPKSLKGEGDGRINILLLGMSGAGHDGPLLTDTIIVASINPQDKTVAMLSIPRDLYVKIPGNGYNKINAAYTFGEEQANSNKNKSLLSSNKTDGPTLSKQVVGDILDLPIHYYLSMDFEGFKQIINQLGGIDVNVDKDLNDPYYPTDNYKYQTFKIAKGQYHMDGDLALKYARSRETTSDFDRASRQQVILEAIKTKAKSLSIFNVKKISSMMNTLGNHMRTDFTLKELERLGDLLKDVDSSKIVNEVLDNSPDGALQDSNIDGIYVLIPKKGKGNYSQIQQIAHSIFIDPYLKKENAAVEIMNGTNKANLAQNLASQLKNYGYNVVKTSNAQKTYAKTYVIDYTGGQKPFTLSFLQKRLSAEQNTMQPVAGSATEILIILGENYQPSSN